MDGYLPPVWRLRPDRPGPCALGLDPREACYVVANGATIDGVDYECSFTGWGGTVDSDGRVSVRMDPVELEARTYVDVTGRPELRVMEG